MPWNLQGRNNTNITQGLEKEMATHSSGLAWRIPGTGEPSGLPSMGSHRVGHNWSDLAAAAATQGFQKKEDKEILPTSFCEGNMRYQHWTRILYERNTTINKQISPLNTYIKFMTQNISTKVNINLQVKAQKDMGLISIELIIIAITAEKFSK